MSKANNNTNTKNKIDEILSNIQDTHGMVLTGFTKSDNRIMRAIIRELNFSAYVLYILLLSHRNANTDECFPTIKVLSNEFFCSQSYISQQLKKLIDAGYINIVPGKKNQASRYFFPYEEFYNPESEKTTKIKYGSSDTRHTINNKPAKVKSEPVQENPEQQENKPAQNKNPEQIPTKPEPVPAISNPEQATVEDGFDW